MHIHATTLKSLLPDCLDVNLQSDMSPSQAALVWQHLNLLKKFHGDKMSRAGRLVGLKKFVESNEICRNWQPERESYYYDLAIRAKERLDAIFHSGPLQSSRINLFDCVQNAMPGPGSSLGTKETSFLTKEFYSTLTTYDASLNLYKFYRDSLGRQFKRAELIRHENFGVSVVAGSKMSFAHKSSDECRTINTEASLEMKLQKGAAAIIEDLLKEFYDIDLRKQPTINRMLARIGSNGGVFATIDMKDGSNRISYKFMEFMLPQDVFQTLDHLRAKCIQVPGDLRKESMKLYGTYEHQCHMFSTQGNGFTFALQTLVFAALVEAASNDLGEKHPVPWIRNQNYSVFGDDIICTNHAYYKVCNLLEWCGFTVNRSKSFATGCFRESCGADFFKGRNIRSVYIKRIQHERHKYSAFNRLCRWSIRTGVDITNCLAYLKGLVEFRPVPFDEHDECGIKVPLRYTDNSGWYSGYQPVPKRVNAKKRVESLGYEGLYGDSVIISALHGSIVNDSCKSITDKILRQKQKLRRKKQERPERYVFFERTNCPKYVVSAKKTPSWDFIRERGLTTLDYEIILIPIV